MIILQFKIQFVGIILNSDKNSKNKPVVRKRRCKILVKLEFFTKDCTTDKNPASTVSEIFYFSGVENIPANKC